MDSNALRKPAAKAIFDEFIMPDLLARDHVSSNGMIHIHYIYLLHTAISYLKKDYSESSNILVALTETIVYT